MTSSIEAGGAHGGGEDHAPVLPAGDLLDRLREGASEGTFSGPTTCRPGIRLDPDPHGRLEGRYVSPRGRLLELRVRVDQPGHWLGLHVHLGPLPLFGTGVIGFHCRTNADHGMAVRACLRSGHPDGSSQDCFFTHHVVAHAGASDHLDALVVGRDPRLPLRASWREFILFLPTSSFAWALQDLRIFAA